MRKFNEFTEEEFIKNYNRIYKDEMIWLILGSLISAENFWEVTENTTDEQYQELLDNYVINIYKLSEIANNICKCNEIPEVDQNKIMNYAIGGIYTLTKEMLSVRKKWEELKK